MAPLQVDVRRESRPSSSWAPVHAVARNWQSDDTLRGCLVIDDGNKAANATKESLMHFRFLRMVVEELLHEVPPGPDHNHLCASARQLIHQNKLQYNTIEKNVNALYTHKKLKLPHALCQLRVHIQKVLQYFDKADQLLRHRSGGAYKFSENDWLIERAPGLLLSLLADRCDLNSEKVSTLRRSYQDIMKKWRPTLWSNLEDRCMLERCMPGMYQAYFGKRIIASTMKASDESFFVRFERRIHDACYSQKLQDFYGKAHDLCEEFDNNTITDTDLIFQLRDAAKQQGLVLSGSSDGQKWQSFEMLCSDIVPRGPCRFCEILYHNSGVFGSKSSVISFPPEPWKDKGGRPWREAESLAIILAGEEPKPLKGA